METTVLLTDGVVLEAAVVSDSMIEVMIVSGSVDIARDEPQHHANAAEAEDEGAGQSVWHHLATTVAVVLKASVVREYDFFQFMNMAIGVPWYQNTRT